MTYRLTIIGPMLIFPICSFSMRDFNKKVKSVNQVSLTYVVDGLHVLMVLHVIKEVTGEYASQWTLESMNVPGTNAN